MQAAEESRREGMRAFPTRQHLETDSMTRQAIFEASVQYFLEPIVPLLDDESVTEVMVNGYDNVYIERRGKLEHTDARFPSDDALLSAIHNVAQWVGREISREHPVLDARLPNGFRVHAIIPPAPGPAPI